MRQRVHAGGGGQFPRQRNGHFRIEYGQLGKKLLFGKRQLDVVVRIGDYRHLGDFRPCPGCGGDDNRRQKLLAAFKQIGAHMILQVAALDH